MDQTDIKILLDKIGELERENANLTQRLKNYKDRESFAYKVAVVYREFFGDAEKISVLLFILFLALVMILGSLTGGYAIYKSFNEKRVTGYFYTEKCGGYDSKIAAIQEVTWGFDIQISPCLDANSDTIPIVNQFITNQRKIFLESHEVENESRSRKDSEPNL